MNTIDPAIATGHADSRPTGTQDDEDDRDDEHPGENEAPVRETDERTEAPEEFEIDDEDEPGQPQDDDADGDGDEDEAG